MKTKSVLLPLSILVLLACIGIGSALLIQHKRNLLYLRNYQEADALFNDSKYEEASEIFGSIYPKVRGEIRIEILYKMGTCYQKTGSIDKAEACWKEVLNSSYPFYHPFVYYKFAQQRLREGNFDQAELYYSKVIEEFPSHPLSEDAMLGPIDIYVAKGELKRAREYCEEIIESIISPRIKEIAIDKLGEINMKLLFSPTSTKISEVYSIKAGDTLSSIARKFNTTVALLEKSNNLKSSVIRPGQKIKVTTNKFSIVMDIKRNELFLNYDDKLFKRYKISSGADDSSTPLGNFEIKEKIKDPTWYPVSGGVIPPSSAENILGSRWMGLWKSRTKTGYGIHEAVDPSDIGKYVTNGCIRMIKEDLEELYDIVIIGTPVKIINSSIDNPEEVAGSK